MSSDLPAEGFVRLSRKFFNNFLWTEQRSFSRAEAWIDLVRTCTYEPQKRMVAGELVDVPRGGIVASERFLSNRWMWSRTKVRAFIDLLISQHMIKRPEKDHRNAVFLLCNFDRYNPQKNHGSDQRKTSEEPPRDQIEEGKEGQERESLSRVHRRPTVEQLISMGQNAGIPEEVCRAFFDACESRPLHPDGFWIDRDSLPIAKEIHALNKFWRHWQNNNKSSNEKRPGSDRRRAENQARVSRGDGEGPRGRTLSA
jgi:hypothetical protein